MSRYTRLLGTRQEQLDSLRKQGWQIVTIKTAPVVAAYQKVGERVWVKAWKFQVNAPAFFYNLGSMAEAEEAVKYLVTNVAAAVAWKAEQAAAAKAKREALKASDHWTVGDVLYNSWGYEQTNVDWYQVVEVKAKSVVIRAIKKNFGASGRDCGYSQPRRDDFCGEPMLKPLSESGSLTMRHGAATKWDGRAVYESSYH